MTSGNDMIGSSTEATTLKALLTTRWSCRSFTDCPVPEHIIDSILDTARLTPSWCNTQPWQVHITEGAATQRLRSDLNAAVASDPAGEPDFPFPSRYEGLAKERRKVSGWQLYESLGIEKGDRVASGLQMLKNFDFFDAPHVAIVTSDATLGTYGAVDCGLFVQSFLLAAHAHGIASIPQAALASRAPTIRASLSLPEDRKVLVGISFGYADMANPVNTYRTERQSLDGMVTKVRD